MLRSSLALVSKIKGSLKPGSFLRRTYVCSDLTRYYSANRHSEVAFRAAEWKDSDTAVVHHWIEHIYLQSLKPNNNEPLLKVVQEMKQYIESNEAILNLFNASFAEVPTEAPYNKDAFGNTQTRDYMTLLKMLNRLITMPQRYQNHFWVGAPLYSVLLWTMHTPSGNKLFLDEGLNRHFKLVLNYYGTFLRSPESRVYLTEDPVNGWFSKDAVASLVDRDGHPVAFDKLFQCDASQPHYGFASWDAYFTRRFFPSQRPVADPEDNLLICNSCESAPMRIATGVKAVDTFWIKGQPYSLQHMLKDEADMVSYFTGGTVYQAFLSAMNYHRWHSPVNGRISRIKHVDGSYYAHCPGLGMTDPTACESQPYMTEVATRALIFIECDDVTVGTVCFMAVGMGEVSTCEVTCAVGDRVRKGEELGSFHLGGSSYCLLFGPHLEVTFMLGEDNTPGVSARNILLNKSIAAVRAIKD